MQQKVTYEHLTCDLIASFNSTVKSCNPCGKGYIPFLPSQCTDGTWVETSMHPEARQKNFVPVI